MKLDLYLSEVVGIIINRTLEFNNISMSEKEVEQMID